MSLVNVASKVYSTENIVLNLLKNSNLWIDFSDSSTYTTTGTGNITLASVMDKSNDARTITVTGTPAFDEANKCMFNLTTTTNYLSANIGGATAAADTETIFLVVSQATNTSTAPSFCGTGTTGARYVRFGPNIGYNAYGSAGIATINIFPASTVFVVTVQSTLGTARVYYNGILHGSGTVNFTVDATTTRIGQTNSGYYQVGNLYEIIFFNEAVPDDQRQLIERYLAQKWKITSTISSPTSVTGCTLWLDGNDESSVVYSSGTNISQWSDKSGNNYHAVQNTAARQPTYDSTAKAVNFVQANIQFMVSTAPYTGSANSEHVYIVFQTNGLTNTDLIGTTDTARGRQIRTTTGARLQTYNGATLVASGSRTNISLTEKNIVEFINVTGRCLVNLNKAVDITSAKVTFATGTWTQVIGGATTSGAVSYDGKIYEIIIFNRALTGSERTSILNYLYTKWRIDPGPTLFTNQPYASLPPFVRPFFPLDINNCTLWLDAADSTTLTLSGSIVTSWKDKSPNGYTGTSSGSPTVVSNVVGKLSAISFNGSTQYFDFGNVNNLGTSSINIYSVVKFNNTGDGTIIAKSLYGTGAGRYAIYRLSGQLVPALEAGGTAISGGLSDSSTDTRIIAMVWNRATDFLYINGSVAYSIAIASTTSLTNTYKLLVGAYNNSSGTTPPQAGMYLNGYIMEIIVYNKTLSVGERHLIEGYLAQKWNISKSLLPSTHTFKSELALSPPFDPRKFSLSLWLDASDTKTLSLSGSSVIQWNDKSGTNNFLSNGAPDYTTTPGGKRAVYFSWNGIQLYSSSNNSTTANAVRTVFLVAQAPNSGSIIRLGTGTHGVATPPSAFGFDINPPVSLVYSPYVYGTADNQWNATVNTLSTFYAYSDGSNIGGSYNYGTIQTKSTTLNTTASPWYMGYRDDGNGCNDAYICEFLHFNATLTTVQRQQVEGYLAWKWGNQSSLPSTHPYAKYPP